jgi:hypothetical protein
MADDEQSPDDKSLDHISLEESEDSKAIDEQKPEIPSDYAATDDDSALSDEFLSSAWEHAFWLAKPKVPKHIVDARYLLQKELALSSIDRTQAHYLSFFVSAAQDFINFGLFGLARDELYMLIAKLQLYRSIGMRERIAQIPGLSTNLTFDMQDRDFEKIGQVPEEEPPQKKSDTINKLMGITKRRR